MMKNRPVGIANDKIRMKNNRDGIRLGAKTDDKGKGDSKDDKK
jgi:hypothetical protein